MLGTWSGSLHHESRFAPNSTGSAVTSTSGSFPSVIDSRSGSPLSRTQWPLVLMPIGTTSYLSRSMACSTLAAVTQEMACSLDRPPNTTATRFLAGSSPANFAAYLGAMAADTPALSPATVVVHAGRPPRDVDQPLNAPITMASTYVAGGDLEYGRYGNPTWSAFEEALGALEGGQALAFSSGLAAVSTVLDLVGQDALVVAPRHAYLGSIGQLGDLESRGRIRTTLVDIDDTDAVVAALDATPDGAAIL